MSESTTSSGRLRAAQRRIQALELRKAGADYRSIGKALGISAQAAWRHVSIALAQMRDVTAEQAAELRHVEFLRLEEATKAVYVRVRNGDVAAIDRFVRLSERRSALMGLDSPKGVQLTGADGGPIRMAALAEDWDLSRLTVEQLKHLREIESAATRPLGEGSCESR